MINNKQKIIDVAFSLSAKYGFDNVSMKQIQEESGLAIGSIYYHFKNKDEILEYILRRYLLNGFDQLRNEVKQLDLPIMEKLRFIINYKSNDFATKEVISEYALKRPNFSHKDFFVLLTSIYHHHPEIRPIFYELHDEMYDFYYEIVKKAIENGEIRDDIDIRILIIFIQTSLKGYVDLWVYQPNFTLEELIEDNLQMIWEAIKKR